MRIHVTGNAGAGKTTLAKVLGSELNVPVHHLDSVVWKSNWVKAPHESRDSKIEAMTEGPHWVIEGVSELVRARADIVLYLDTPRYKCMFRCIKRCLIVGFKTRPEMPPSCPEIAILFRALKIVWRFPLVVGRKLAVESEQHNFFVCRDSTHARKQLHQFLNAP